MPERVYFKTSNLKKVTSDPVREVSPIADGTAQIPPRAALPAIALSGKKINLALLQGFSRSAMSSMRNCHLYDFGNLGPVSKLRSEQKPRADVKVCLRADLFAVLENNNFELVQTQSSKTHSLRRSLRK